MGWIAWMSVALVVGVAAIVAGVAGLAACVFVWTLWAGGEEAWPAEYLADRAYPVRRWAHGALALYRGEDGDPGYWPAQTALHQLQHAWNVPDRGALLALLARYEGPGEVNVAFDKVRIVWLARAGAGAGWLTPDESWVWVARAQRNITGQYRSWSEVRGGVMDGVRLWWGASGPPPGHLEALRRDWHVAQPILDACPF